MPKLTYKIVLVGNAAVGKTNIILRYVRNTFIEDLGATIGVNFLNKLVTLDYKGKEYQVDLVIWDIGGYTINDLFTLKELYCKGAQAAIYVYDITRQETFEDLTAWETTTSRYTAPDIIRCLVGNKKDLKESREVSQEEGRKKARTLKASFFFETSAKTGEEVETMFKQLTRELLTKFMKRKIQSKSQDN